MCIDETEEPGICGKPKKEMVCYLFGNLNPKGLIELHDDHRGGNRIRYDISEITELFTAAMMVKDNGRQSFDLIGDCPQPIRG